ncbi:vomeronasal type-2 receptor 26-like [Leptodactylus fuscus]|uniref:vomeronasal type-2 receptor 26-like n=1 Tax=Leptodactylus fuscus TaxID=238119 RepID=UPI003F4E8F70
MANLSYMQTIPLLRSYAALLAFLYAVAEINNNPDLLPNITLGYHVYDAHEDEIKSVQSVLHILSGADKNVPNYSCLEHGEVAGFVGYHFEMEQILQLYGYTKISYGIKDKLFNKKDLEQPFFTMAQDVHNHHLAIVFCLKHFEWNWIGIITTRDDNTEAEVLELSREMSRHGICIEFIVRINTLEESDKQRQVIEKYRAQVIVIYGSFSVLFKFLVSYEFIEDKTLILDDSWFAHPFLGSYYMKLVNCSLSFSPVTTPLPDLWKFIHSWRPKDHPEDELLEDIFYFYCVSSNETYNLIRIHEMKMILKYCSDEYFVTQSIYPQDGVVSNVYTAVTFLAIALHNMILFQKSFYSGRPMSRFIDKLPQLGKYSMLWAQIHYSVFKNTIEQKPQSRCNDKCPPGSRKAPNGGYHVCCYDCVPCSEGEMSNTTDSEICRKCPEDQWPDPEKTRCLPRVYEFLSYEDAIASFFSVTVILCCAITCFIIRQFIIYWDTPLVKANNRTVSFILLVSIFLSLLCVFFFVGCPVNITCKLRPTFFGFFFSTVVSCVLAKTIMVYIAFKATKPGSSLRKLVGVRSSYYIVGICSSIQLLICIVWLLVSPPYVEFDHHSYPGKIIIQCNEGSDLWFYSMLGYMGLLAAVSFLLAFMVRTLPDSFNEAKYITFSMLLFCSVWIAMIPAYLSTRGKYMVAVEIFAILTSSAGILGCIFFPKLYILSFKLELNCRKQIVEKEHL